MTRNEIWQALRSSLLEVFPEYTNLNIIEDLSLRELGANSVDRAEIIMLTLTHLNLNIPLVEFANVKNMIEIVDLLCQQIETF